MRPAQVCETDGGPLLLGIRAAVPIKKILNSFKFFFTNYVAKNAPYSPANNSAFNSDASMRVV